MPITVFTVLENSGTIVEDLSEGVALVETVLPELEEAEQAIVAGFKAPAEKMKTDIEAMPSQGGSLKQIVTDVETFFSDAGNLAASAGNVVSLAESKVGDIWTSISAKFTKIKTDFENIAGTPTVANPTAAAA